MPKAANPAPCRPRNPHDISWAGFTGFVTQQSLVRDADPEQSDPGELLTKCRVGISRAIPTSDRQDHLIVRKLGHREHSSH